MENEAVVAVRMKYAEDLEELVQCPVCFERPAGRVPTCVQGHHVCSKCQAKIKYCPLCNTRFKGSRNYLAEGLCAKLDDILSSLLDPSHTLNKKVLNNMRSASTQTVSEKVANDEIENEKRNKCTCKIGFCQSQLPASCMFFHVQDFHKTCIIEANVLNDRGFIKYWNLEYATSKLYDYGLSVKDMGFFFFNVYVDEQGNLHAKVEVVDSCYIERMFDYTLIVTNNETGRSLGYDGPVSSCEVEKKFPFACTFDKELFESYFEKDLVALKNKSKPFTCRLILTRLNTASKMTESEEIDKL